MYFTAQSKKPAGTLTFKQIFFSFTLLIILVGQISAFPVYNPECPNPPTTCNDVTRFSHSEVPLGQDPEQY